MKRNQLLSRFVPGLFLLGAITAGAGRAGAQANVTITRMVNTGNDDVEENVPGGSMYMNSSDLEMMLDGSQLQNIGIRFANLNIPSGATIQNAFIQFTTKGDKAPVSGAVTIKGQDIDDAPTFTTAASNVSSRAVTAASVSWAASTSTTWGTSGGGNRGAEQRTVQLKTIVQAVVNRAGWQPGNAMAFILSGSSGVRNAYSFEGNNSYAPELIVQYTTATPPALPLASFPITKNSQWTYLDNGVSQDATNWKLSSFDDALWSRGAGKLGYSDNALSMLNYGPDGNNKYISYYFRKQFNVPSVAALSHQLQLSVLRDDGAVVYINGVEVVRSNMDAGPFTSQTFSSTTVDGADESTYFPYIIPRSVLADGVNTIAVEVHQRDGTSSDLGFDLQLIEAPEPTLIRGPYLNAATPQSIHVRWRTDMLTNTVLNYGTAANALGSQLSDAVLATNHEVVITGLQPHTKYWYSIGSSDSIYQGDANNFFMTTRTAGDTALMRIGVIGDCGNNSTNQINVRNQLASYLGSNYMDSWILLGDNAYSSGTDAEFQAEFFNIYKDGFLKQNPLYPAPGNHDYSNGSSARQADHAIPYYDMFSMPTAGEAGGIASNNQAYYSFNIGNTHFLSLDSYGKEDAGSTRLYDTLGAQVQWIKQDLAANTNKGWVVAYWHHPPYTMGSHTSDGETELVKIRENFIRILERMGVDLILCGHSHDYERSKLMKGHYGMENTFNAATHNVSQSSGLYDGSAASCPYVKDSATNYEGTVYVVSGSAGQLGGSQAGYPHNALAAYSNATNGGSMILEIQGNRLDAKWICADGQIRDKFTMMKDANFRKIFTINQGSSIDLSAGYNGTYNWTNTAGNSKTVTVTPTDTTVYVVKDAYDCVTDSFVVNVLVSTPLSIRFDKLAVRTEGAGANRLSWSTLAENTGDSFEIERSQNGRDFSVIARLAAAGQSTTYSYRDASLPAGVSRNYYRVRVANPDGGFTYSNVVSVYYTDAVAAVQILVAPNPARTKEMMISIQDASTANAGLRITDATGRVMMEKNIRLSSTPQAFLPELSKGIYILSVQMDGRITNRKIVIE